MLSFLQYNKLFSNLESNGVDFRVLNEKRSEQ